MEIEIGSPTLMEWQPDLRTQAQDPERILAGLNALSKAATVAAEKASAARAEAEAQLTATLNSDSGIIMGVPPSPAKGGAGAGGGAAAAGSAGAIAAPVIDLGLMSREEVEKMCVLRGEKLQVCVAPPPHPEPGSGFPTINSSFHLAVIDSNLSRPTKRPWSCRASGPQVAASPCSSQSNASNLTARRPRRWTTGGGGQVPDLARGVQEGTEGL